MEKIQFGLLGAGGSAREVMPFVKKSVSASLKVSPSYIDVFFVETWQPKNKDVNGYPLVSLDEFKNLNGAKYFNVAVGNGRDRENMAAMASEFALPLSLFSPQTIIFDANSIAEGAIFCPNTMVTSNVIVGRFFHCNVFAHVSHDCVIGDFVTFAPGVRCNGRVHIGDYAHIGANAVIREGTPDKPLLIGKDAVVGMGAVVTKNVPDGTTVIGNPARPMNKK